MKHVEISDELWTRLSTLLPKYKLSTNGGRPRLDIKKVFEGIIFVKVNKLPWKAMPEVFGSKTAINDYYRNWAKDGIFHALKELGFLLHPDLMNVNFDWEKIEDLHKES